MEQTFPLERYLTDGVEDIVKQALRATLKNPRESAFMAKYALASKRALKLRQRAEAGGEHIPPFLIASITSQCNLHCAGCYARANHACADGTAADQLTDREWGGIFQQARELGVGFILLAGGEPLLRREVLVAAGEVPEILFPVFTNGTLLDQSYLALFDRCRNLFPVLSIEGRDQTTDQRRGAGVYDKLIAAMDALRKRQLLFGVSVTVTRENLQEVTGDAFLEQLAARGCKIVFYVEFVPVTAQSRDLAPGDEERATLMAATERLRKAYDGQMLLIAFPGDEAASGGCLAAGRGFFHINARGGAEPCPFSPYSDCNVRDTSLRQALRSPLFTQLQGGNLLTGEHVGGCVLFEKRQQVEALLK